MKVEEDKHRLELEFEEGPLITLHSHMSLGLMRQTECKRDQLVHNECVFVCVCVCVCVCVF